MLFGESAALMQSGGATAVAACHTASEPCVPSSVRACMLGGPFSSPAGSGSAARARLLEAGLSAARDVHSVEWIPPQGAP